MIKPYHIRKCKTFSYDEEIIIKDNQNIVILSMKPLNEKFIEKKVVVPFECKFDKKITKKIKIDEQLYEGYVIPNNFKAYYFKEEKLLIFNSSKTVINEFIKLLKDMKSFEFDNINFDLKKILESGNSMSKGMYFNHSDANVRSKSFHGTHVERNREADSALKNGDVTYITVAMDVPANGKISQKTINISKNSSISIVSNLETEDDYIELVYNTYLTIVNLF